MRSIKCCQNNTITWKVILKGIFIFQEISFPFFHTFNISIPIDHIDKLFIQKEKFNWIEFHDHHTFPLFSQQKKIYYTRYWQKEFEKYSDVCFFGYFFREKFSKKEKHLNILSKWIYQKKTDLHLFQAIKIIIIVILSGENFACLLSKNSQTNKLIEKRKNLLLWL